MVQSRNLFANQLRIKVVTLLELVYSQLVIIFNYWYMKFKCLIQDQYLLNLIDEGNPTAGQTA